MTKALIVVDVQNDFCEGGALAVEGGSATASHITSYVANGAGDYGCIVATRDRHVEPRGHFSDDPDYVDTWPAHCVAGTPGQEFHPNLGFRTFDAIFDKGEKSAAYSGFEGRTHEGRGTALVEFLRSRGVDAVDVCGIATDHCVKATALDAARLGFDTSVLIDLTAAVNPDGVKGVKDELSAQGVHIRHVGAH